MVVGRINTGMLLLPAITVPLLISRVQNRSIGSGIFLTPHLVLAGTGCVGGALCVWALVIIMSLCGIYVWL